MKYIKKYALILDDKDGKIMKLAKKLKNLNFRIVQTGEVNSSLEILKKSNQISIFLINSIVCKNNPDVIEKVYEINTSITTVWFEGKVKTNFPGNKPKVTINFSKSALELEKVISKRLLNHVYPEDMLEVFTNKCEEILQKSFKTFTTPRESFLRSSNKLFSDTAAIAHIHGNNIRGQLIVSASYNYAGSIFTRFSGDSNYSRSQIWDLLGEMCNLMSGTFKTCFPSSENCTIGLPTVVHGKEIEIIPKYNQPSLVLAFDDDADTIFVEFIFDIFDSDQAFDGKAIEEVVDEDDDVCFL